MGIKNYSGVSNAKDIATKEYVDSVAPSPYTSNPLTDGTASPGSSSNYSRGDHRHPTDTSRAPTSHASSATTYGVSTGTNYGHSKASSTSPKMDGTAAVGSETSSFARGDHVHPTDTSRASSSDLTSHTGNTIVHITSSERTTWNGKQDAITTSNKLASSRVSYSPTGSIVTGTDVASALSDVETDLEYGVMRVDSSATTGNLAAWMDGIVIDSGVDATTVEFTTNKVTTVTASSTDDEYPTAKCLYDIVGNIEAALAALR